MTPTSSRPNFLWRTMRKFGATRPGTWLFSRTLHPTERLVLRLSRGKVSITRILGGLPVVTVTALGAKSGKPRSVALIAIPVGDDLAIIASNWGQKRHPSWFYNVRANPEVTVAWNGRSRRYVAREVTGAEREQIYETAVAMYIGYAVYVRRAGDRHIPVFLLTPSE